MEEQIEHSTAFLDTGFPGQWVAGSARFEALRKTNETHPVEKSGQQYRFGGGVASAVGTHRVLTEVNGQSQWVVVDVVKGKFPLLCGRAGGAALRLVADTEQGAVLQRAGPALQDITAPSRMMAFYVAPSCGGKGVQDSQNEKWQAVLAGSLAEGETTGGSDTEGSETESESENEAGENGAPDPGEQGSREGVKIGPKRPNTQKSKKELAHESARAQPAPKRQDQPPRRLEAPRALSLTEAEIRKMHRAGHATARRLLDFLRASIPSRKRKQFSAQWAALRERVAKVTKECTGCVRNRRRVVPGTRVPECKGYGEKGWVDFMCLDHQSQQWAIIVVDDATADVGWAALPRGQAKAETAWRGYVQAWAGRHGPHKNLVSDVDGSLVAKDFRDLAEKTGLFKTCTAGAASESHGKVERTIQTFRWSLDRVRDGDKGPEVRRVPKTRDEWQYVLDVVGNAIRNEVRVGGGSASLRAYGRETSMARNLLTDTAATAPHEGDPNLSVMQEEALEAYREVVFSKKLRRLLAQKERPQPAEYQPGEKVLYCREPDTGRGAKWHGPAVVVGPTIVDEVRYYLVDHGSTLLRVRPVDLQLADEKGVPKEAAREAPGDPVTDEPKAAQGSVTGDTGCHTSPKAEQGPPKVVAEEYDLAADDGPEEDEEASDDEGGLRPLRRSRRLAGESADCLFAEQDAQDCLFAEIARNERDWEVLAGDGEGPALGTDASAAYGYVWADVSEEEQRKSDERAVRDYDEHGAWDRSTTATIQDLRKRGEVVLRGRHVRKAKVVDGKLIGRSRWTPKGFQERGVEKGDVDSPTVNTTTERVVEGLGLRKRWVAFQGDVSSAFFQGKKFTGERLTKVGKRLWVEVPEGDPEYDPQVPKARLLLKEVPGTKGAPRAWHDTLAAVLLELGLERSKIDPCLFYLVGVGDQVGLTVGYVHTHVDDLKGRAEESALKPFLEKVEAAFKVKFGILRRGDEYDYVGVRRQETEQGTEYDQEEYVRTKLKEVPLDKQRAKHRSAEAAPGEVREFRGTLGSCSWVTGRTRPEGSYETSAAASAVNRLEVGDILRLNKLVRYLKEGKQRFKMLLRRLPGKGRVKVVILSDAGEGENHPEDWTKAQAGRVIGLMEEGDTEGHIAVVEVKSGKCVRVTHSSFDGETVGAVQAVDSGLAVAMLVEEFEFGVLRSRKQRLYDQLQGLSETRTKTVCELHTPGKGHEETKCELHVDAKCLVDRVASRRLDVKLAKRRKQDVSDLKECVELGELEPLVKVDGKYHCPDALTKGRARTKDTAGLLVKLLEQGIYFPI